MHAKGNVSSYTPPITICCLALCLLVACVGTIPHTQLRTLVVPDPLGKDSLGNYTDTTNLTDDALSLKVGERVVESYTEFDLSIVEFDDQGKFWDKKHQLVVLDKLVEDPAARQNGAIILVFVHGWQENTDVLNPTVGCFRQILYQWYLDERQDTRRRIIGVYVGWRGKSQRLPLLKSLTFWTRKKVAHKIGRGDMDELLVHLGDLKHQLMNLETPAKRRGTRLVVIGHSFGGAIVFSALDNILKKSTLESVVPLEKGETNKVGVISTGTTDLVVLLNPAFETLLYSGLAEATTNCTEFNNAQTTVLMTIGAQNDTATGVAFPIGQFFPTLLQNFKPHSDERRMNKTALGHYTPYFDYQLTGIVGTNSSSASASDRKHNEIHIRRKENARPRITGTAMDILYVGIGEQLNSITNRQWNLVLYPGKKEPPPPRSPFLVISATKDIVDNHTGIWGDPLVEFLRDFISIHDQRKAEAESLELSPKP
jgi:pimeloyl-ACP methyl ester carboxylesterase